jgi:NAD(P)-dependent dehydrogenase (short-subunit alcohol dehydrogenase family)
LDLRDRVALVTGASRGIGLAIAEGLAREGAHVALVARDRNRIEEQAARIAGEYGSRALGFVADTGDDAAVEAMVRSVRSAFGAPCILVNAAATPSASSGMGEDDIEREINVKVRGYLRCVRALAPDMVANGWGRIINVGGLAMRRSTSLVGSLRNAAVASMTKALADELGPSGINVTVLHPGWTVTTTAIDLYRRRAAAEGTDSDAAEAIIAREVVIGRPVTADEVASVAVFLASPRSVALAGDGVFATGGVAGATYY